ncbi:MAG TPA: hypothetical protein VIH04_07950 [Nitrosarchaeum sp.]
MNIRSIQEINPVRQLPFPKLHLTTMRDTIVGCTGCLTNRFNIVKRADGSMYKMKCPSCRGTGNTYISNEGLSKR